MTCGCSLLCAKAFLILFNGLFLLTGGAILGAGLWLHFDKEMVTYVHVLHSTPSGPLLQTAAYILIGVGAFVLIIGFLGCCGACCESICMLCLYSLLVFIVLAAEIAAAVLIVLFKDKIGDYVSDTLEIQIKLKYNRTRNQNQTDVITVAWDYMQVHLNCCGSLGPQDYIESLWYNQTRGQAVSHPGQLGVSVPATCCVLVNDDPKYPQVDDVNQCQIDAIMTRDRVIQSSALRTKGCYHAIVHWLEKHLTTIIIVASVLAVLQFFGLVLACCLMVAIRRHDKDTWEDDIY